MQNILYTVVSTTHQAKKAVV